MQEAWCRSWRQCVQTLPLHTPPVPHQVVPLEHFCVGRNSCWTVALTHPKSLTWGPDPVVQQCCFLLHFQWKWLYMLQGQDWFKKQRLLQTPDLVVLLISCLLKCSYCWCVCVFVPLLEVFIKLPLTYLAKNKMTYWNWEAFPFFYLSKELY